jgi:hypothetical protein
VAKYTDAIRAETLAALQANGGNLSSTHRATGIPIRTIARWRDEPDPRLGELANEKKAELSDSLERIANALVNAIPGKIDEAPLNHVSIALGIAIDKLRLLRGEATEVTEVRGSDAKHELAQRLARLTTRPQSEPTPPN